MKNNRILLIALLLCSAVLFAQDPSEGVKKHQLKVNLIASPSIDYELGVGTNSTFQVQLGAEFAFVEDVVTDDIYFGMFPSAKLSFRHYYNFKRRVEKEKNTANNSANYFGVTTSYINSNAIFIENDVKVFGDYFQIGGLYGFQRTYFNRLNLGVEGGIGYSYDKTSGGNVVPILTFNLGWILL